MTIRDRLLDVAWHLGLVLAVVELMATTWKRDPCSDQPGDTMGGAVGELGAVGLGEIPCSSQSSEQ